MNNNSNNITSTASQFQSELNNWFQTALDKAIHIAICVIALCVVVLVICVVVFCIVRFRRKKQIAQAQKEVNVVHSSNNVGLENVSKNKAKQMGFQQLQDVSNVPPQNDGGLNTQHKDNMSLSEIRIKNMQMNNNNGGNNSISVDSAETSNNNNNNVNEGKTKKTKGGNKKGKRTNKGSSRISKMNINNVNDNFEGHNYANTESGDKEVDRKKHNKNKMAKVLITEKDMEDELKKQMNKYQFS